jgi:hypothetical protein
MNPQLVADKLSVLAKKIESSNGPLELFGLFLREDSPDLWDLVIAAPWLSPGKRASYEYVAGLLQETLTEEELVGLSRIVILEHGRAVLRSFLESFHNRPGFADVHFVSEGGAVIEKAYIIIARSAASDARPEKTKKQRRAHDHTTK